MPFHCAVCGGESTLRCSRCRDVHYCTPEHQAEAWKTHKSKCKSPPWIGNLRKLAGEKADDIIKRAKAIEAKGFTDVYEDPRKGRGLRARISIPEGTPIAIIVGRTIANDISVKTVKEYMYTARCIVADLGFGEPCLPSAINGSHCNDPMAAKTYAALLQGSSADFTTGYFLDVPMGNITMHGPVAMGDSVAMLELRTRRAIAPGEPLEYSYGSQHWRQMIGSCLLPTTFRVAWEGTHRIVRGDPEAVDTLSRVIKPKFLKGMLANYSPSQPVWFHLVGIRATFAGRYGITYHPISPDAEKTGSGVTSVVHEANLTDREQKDPTALYLDSVYQTGRFLRALLPPGDCDERKEAVSLVADAVRELPGYEELPNEYTDGIAQDIINEDGSHTEELIEGFRNR